MRNSRKGAQGVGDRVVADSRHACRCGRGRRVLAVVRARDQRLGREDVVPGELDSVDPESPRNHVDARALQDAELGVAVRLERAVPVEVVRLEIQEDGHVARELVDVLELETGELTHDPRVRRQRPVEPRQRPADVAGDRHESTRGSKHRTEQLGRGRLAVRARDADERV